MRVLEYMQERGHEEVAFWNDPETGLRAIIAIHDTTLGPSLGGVRMWPYASEEEALWDVLRLSEAMTYKAAVAGLDLGGGKAVIIGDPLRDKSEARFRSFGRFVDSLNGRYITAEDVGTAMEDLVHVKKETRYATGLPTSAGGSGDSGLLTGRGVYRGIKACCRAAFGSDSLQGRTIAVQGVGKVGHALVELLVEEQARVVAADANRAAAARARREFGLELVDPDEIYDVDCDVLAPCALGAVLNDETIPRLRCAVVAGGANNQLAEDRHGDELYRRGMLYAPDYVINAGGLISVASELGLYSLAEARARTEAIYDTVWRVINLARQEDIPTHQAAHRLARERIERHRHGLAEVH